MPGTSSATSPDGNRPPAEQALYAGDPAGRRYLEFAGIAVQAYNGEALSPDQVLIVGSGGGRKLAGNGAAIAAFLKAGGHVLALGLDEQEANGFLPFKVGMTTAEHIAAYFEPPRASSLLAGVAPADVHNRAPRKLPLVTAGATVLGDGVLAQAQEANVVFFQLPPYSVSSAGGTPAPQAEEGVPSSKQFNLRRTYRRTAVALARLLGNMGVSAPTPLLSRFALPVGGGEAQPAASVVRNGDFRQAAETGAVPAPWQFSSDSRQAGCTRQPLGENGAGALSLAMRGAVEKGQNVMLTQQGVPVKEAQWYRISLRAKAEGMAGKTVTLALQNTRTWTLLFDYQSFAPTEKWRTYQFLVQSNGTAGPNTRFQIWHGNTGTLWLADISMAPVSPPAAGRWSQGLYLDQPVDWDDPYRFFRW